MNFQKVSLPAGLYFVGVPIGSARDITLRALDVLASAEVLVAEDTRSLKRLLDIHGIPVGRRKIIALHDHSKSDARDDVLAQIAAGRSVAYSSEAGMPLISDPGFDLGRAAQQAGFVVTSAPGPSAVVTALVLSGLPADMFFFAGFLPNAASARRSALEALREIPATLVFYESPKRLGDFLEDAAVTLGEERAAAVCRELTKKFEEIKSDKLRVLADAYAGKPVKGEIVVVVDRNRSEKITTSDLEGDLKAAMEVNTIRDAVDIVAKAHALPRRKVYQLALDLTKG